MKKQELERLAKMENRILAIAEEEGLDIEEIIFEVVPARRMIEAMAYMFPVNFSHWSFGRDYDYHRTIYDATGAGIPYEQVWNFETPKALLVETNPFALNVLTMAHVVGHVDFFRRNRYTRHGRSFSDIAEEARFAAERFRTYESRYGENRVESIIDAGMSLRWHRPRDLLTEEPDLKTTREYLIADIQAKIKDIQRRRNDLGKERAEIELKELERELLRARHMTPPEPVYDILKHVIEHAPRLLRWERDILKVLWNQARALAPNIATKMLNEGWATYWHTRIMRRLFAEKLLSEEEHGVFTDFHNKVTQKSRASLNVYNVGPAIYEYAEECWDKGRFGKEYDACRDQRLKALWDTQKGAGREKIREMSGSYTDHMAIMEFFTPEFIHGLELYIYETRRNEHTGDTEYVIVEKKPEVIRQALMHAHALYGMPSIVVANSNYGSRGELYLKHEFDGTELDGRYASGALQNTHYAWRKPVHLETVHDGKDVLYTFDGKKISIAGKETVPEPEDDGLMEL